MVQKAAEAGFHLNDELNGIVLEKFSKVLENGVHGNHPAYSKFVEWNLQRFVQINGNHNISSENSVLFLQKELIPELRQHINLCIEKNLNLNQYFSQLNKKRGIF